MQKLLIFINHFFNYFFYKIKLKKIKKLNIKHLFFSDKKFYYNKFKGKYINNLIDPYFDLLTNEKKLKIEIIQNVIPNKPKLFKPTYLNLYSIGILNLIFYKFNFLSKIKFRNEFYLKINKIEKKYLLKLDKFQINKDLENIILQSTIFEKILKNINPKIVYISCYYSLENFAISYACNKLKIKCIDIQHGGIENYHLMYSNWNSININKNNLLPKNFMIWDKRQITNKTLPNKKIANYSEVGKLPIKYWSQNKTDSDDYTNLNTRNFLESTKKYKRVILVCLTTIFPPQVIRLINSTPTNYFWLIRSHPRHGNLNNLHKILKKKIKNNRKYNLILASTIDINFLLEISNRFITDYSSTIYDADYFKIPKLSIQKKNYLFESWKRNKICIFETKDNKIKQFLK